MRNQGKKTFVFTTLAIYIASLCIQQLSELFEVRAQNTNIPHVNMVAVFVDDSIYTPLAEDIQRYATQYIQQEIPESKALVMPLNLQTIDAPQISHMLENMYFDGLSGVNSTLLGVILIGNIPLPVINQAGYLFPSIYPYVDFLEQKYVRNPDDQYFVPNGNSKGQAEIRHGLIDYDGEIADYKKFFNKIKTYRNNPQSFIGKDIWYEDFIANRNGFLEDNLQFYQNKILFSEDIGYQRFTPLMLKMFQGKQNEGAEEIATDLAATMKELGGSLTDENGNAIDIAAMVSNAGSSTDKGLSTKVVEKTIKESFLLDYPKVYSTQNAVILRDNVMAGGRWLTGYTDDDGAQLITRADSSTDKINLKDVVNGGNTSVQGALISFNNALERAVDEKIESEKYDMDIVLPVSYTTIQAEKVGGCKRVLGIKICKNKTNKYLESKYEVFYFGKSANLISNAQELSIYRGSYRNLTGLDGINSNTIQASINPAITPQDKTNLSLKSLGASYDIFSTQVEANRGYNILNTQDEYNHYEKNKTYAGRTLKCASRRPFSWWKMVCTKVISEPIGSCHPEDTNTTNDGDCETIPEFTQRRRGGGSPINLDFEKINEGIYILENFNGKNALNDIFDIGGSKALTTPQFKANSYVAASEYASPTALQIARKAINPTDTTDGDLAGKFTTINKRLPDEHLTFNELDFFTIYNNGKDNNDYHDTWKIKPNSPTFDLYRETNRMGKRKESHTFKVISSIVKNISTLSNQLNGIKTTKFGTGSYLTNYYQRIINDINSLLGTRFNTGGTLDEIKNIGTTIVTNLSTINTELSNIETSLFIIATELAKEEEERNLTTITTHQGNISTYIDNIKKILRDNKFSNGNTSQSLEDLYNLLQTVQVNSLLNTLKNIEDVEYETLYIKKQQIEFASGRISTINTELKNLQNMYTNNLIQTYKTQYQNINTLLTNFQTRIITMCQNKCSDDLSEILSLIGTSNNNNIIINTDGIDFNGDDDQISTAIKNKIPNDMRSFFHIKDIDINCSDENTCSDTNIKFGKLTANDFTNTSLTQDISSKIQELFTGKNIDEQLDIPGLNMLTPDRPIDSPRYVTFQGINAQEVKFIYPNLYKVEIYKADSNGHQILKTIPEIKSALESYLKNKVNEYNIFLTGAQNAKQSMNAAYNKLKSLNFKGATPDIDTSVRPYNLFTYDDLLTALGGTGQLDTITEMLYYQNLTNTEKQSDNLIEKDIINTRSSFDISNKVQYTLKEYLTEGNNKSPLVLPTYKPKGYEVAYINSDEKDRIIAAPIFPTELAEAKAKKATAVATKPSTTSSDDSLLSSVQELADECGIPTDGSVLLFDFEGPDRRPRFTAFGCRLKQTLATPGKLTLDFSASLGPSLADGSFGEYFTKEKENTLEPRAESMEDFGQERKDLISTDDTPETLLYNKENSIESTNTTAIQADASKRLSTFYSKIKTYLNTTTINEKNPTAQLSISSIENVGLVDINIILTGSQSCLKIDNTDLCKGERTKSFNPNTTPQTLTLTPSNHKAGISLLIIKMCIPNSANCVSKTQRITVQEGALAQFNIQAPKTSIVGMLTPIRITAQDAYQNPVTRTPVSYLVSVSSGKFLHEGGYKTSFTTNSFKNLNFYYQAAPLEGNAQNGNATIIITPADTNDTTSATGQLIQPIINAKPHLTINAKAVSSSGLTFTLPEKDDLYTTGTNNLKQFNLRSSQLQTVNLKILNSATNQPVAVDSDIRVSSANKLITIGTTGTKVITATTPKSNQLIFKQQGLFTLTTGQLSFYFYSNKKAGNDTLKVEIPGLEPLLIPITIKPAPLHNIDIELSATQAKIGETVKGTIFLTDIRGNRILNETDIIFTYNSGLATSFPLNNTLTVPAGQGQRAFTLSGKVGGMGYLIANAKNNTNVVPGIAEITFQEPLFPSTSGLNIMYLNYFGSDRGNQRGYFSQHNKYIEHLMKQSNKLITTTTQLVQPSKINAMLRGIAPNFVIKTYGGGTTQLTLGTTGFQLQIENIATAQGRLNSLERTLLDLDTLETTLSGAKQLTKNTAFFLSSEETEEADFQRNGSTNITAYLTDYVIEGYQAREVRNGNTISGTLFLHLPNYQISANNFTTTNTKYLVQPTFSNGSSNNTGTIGIFDTTTSFALEGGYLSIQDSYVTDNAIGFRGDFKNMTLFAQGENVGDATRKYGSELLINLGDPLLRNYDTNPNVYDTNYDGGLGVESFNDPTKTIFTVKPIDFNNDKLKDLLIVYTDGTVKLAKNYGHGVGQNFQSLENLLLIAVGIDEVFVGDIDNNHYEDIIIRTTTNQLRVYLNKDGKFDVDGYPVCLNTNVNPGEISTTPHLLSSVHQTFLEDMDKDGAIDILTNDHKGFVKIFYGGERNARPTYLSTNNVQCDPQRYERQKADTTIITRFGIKIDESSKIIDNSMVHWKNIEAEMPNMEDMNIDDPENVGVDMSNLSEDAINQMIEDLNNNPEDTDINQLSEMLGAKNFDTDAMANAGLEYAMKYQEITTPYPLHTTKTTTGIFIPISYLTGTDKVKVHKIYEDLNGGILEKGDIVKVTVYITANQPLQQGAFGDIIQGPREIKVDENNIIDSLSIKHNPTYLIHPQDSNFSYLIENINLSVNGRPFTYTYQLIYQDDIPSQTISLEDINGSAYGTGYQSIRADGLLDIKSQPIDGCVRYLQTFINEGTSKKRTYTIKGINFQEIIDEHTNATDATSNENAEQQKQALTTISGSMIPNVPGLSDTINLKDLISEGFQGGINLDINIFDEELGKVQQELEKVAAGLCNGFTFGGSNTCKGLPVPFNQAFLAPGAYHILGCIKLPLTPLDKGLPVFSFPTLGPLNVMGVPIPPFRPINFQGAGGIFGGSSSQFRIYVAPTLTLQLGIAMCFGPYSIGKALPSPFRELGGNCIVTAIKLPCGNKGNSDNPAETYDPTLINNLSNANACNTTAQGAASSQQGYSRSAFQAVNSTINLNNCQGLNCLTANQNDAYGAYIPSSLGGIINLNREPSINSIENTITINGVKIQGGTAAKNRIKSGLQQGLRKILIDNRLDPQIRYLANNLTKMHISLKRPDLKDFGAEIKKIGEIVGKIKNAVADDKPSMKEILADTSYRNLSAQVEKVNDNLANPFEKLTKLFNQNKLINIQTKNMTVKIPMIYREDINSYEIYLRQRADTNGEIIKERTERTESLIGICFNAIGKGEKNPPRREEEGQKAKSEKRNEYKTRCNNNQCDGENKDKEACKQHYCDMITCEETVEQKVKEMVDLSNDYENILDRINENILILQEYRNLPFELYERVHAIDRYVAEISAIMRNFFGYISYWMTTNANRFSSYVDAIILIMDVIKTYQVLIDFSVNWGNKCATCTNDTYDQHSCTLSLLCQGIKLPIIQIPNIKIPDIIIDFSELNLNMNILLPTFNFQPIKVDLPTIPNLPTPPIIDINFTLPNISLPSAPEIPELPAPPHLPELPSFIPNIKLELPVLPPAPQLPQIPHEFEATLKLAEKIGRIYCIVKQGIGLVGEGEVKAKIEQLTQRTYEVPRFDTIVDLTNKLKFPKPELNGFDYEIDAQANLQFNFGTIYGFLDNLTTAINNLSTAVSYNISDGMNSISKVAQDGADIVENCINNPEQCKTEVSMFNGLTTDEINYVDYPQAKSRLENVLAYFNTQASQDETTLRELKAIQSTLTTPRTIEANQQGVEEMQQQISKLITDEQSKIQLTQATLSSDYDQLIRALEKETSLTQAKEEKNLAFNLNFFNVDQGTEKLLTTMENPYKILLDNKAPIIDNFLNEINTTSPELLNMTLPEYQRNKQTLSTLKNQLAGFYQRLQPTYQTSLQTKQGSSTTKTLTAQSKGTTAASSSQSMSIDPAAYVNGIFVKTNSSTATKSSLTKVVYSERNAESIGTNYYTTPLNTDNADDIILWDDHNVYIKYGNQNDNFNGPHNTTKTYFMKAISTLPSEKRIINFDDNTKLKVSDYHEEVRNFAVRGQSFDAISLGRRPNREASVAGYLIKLTDRIDYSPEKEDTNKKLIETYILVLPKGTDTTGMKLTTFPTQKRLVTNELLINDEVQNRATPALKEATKNKLIAEIRYYDPNQSAISVILENIERKRQYARITTLRNENNTLQISAPRSNQVVAGKQILGDDEGPQGEAQLYRIATQEVVSEGDALEGVVGTYYNLIMHRTDNVALATMQQEVNGTMVQTLHTTNASGDIIIENLFFTGADSLNYRFHATDHEGNTTTKDIVLAITIPDITITNIEKNSEKAATITAELSQDVDTGTVSFQKNRNGYWVGLAANPSLLSEWGSSEQPALTIEDYPLSSRITTITGQYYSLNDKIGLYSSSHELIAEIDPNTGAITFKDKRKDKMSLRVSLSAHIPIIQVYNLEGTLMFTITLPTQQLVAVEAPAYTSTTIDDSSFGIFQGGKAIHRNGENMLFVAPTGQIYSDKNLYGTYAYHPDQQTISYLFKESALSPESDTITITIKIAPFKK